MGLKQELDSDIDEVLNQIENQNTNDKRETLRNLLNKHIHLNTCDYLIDHHDLRTIISNAKSLFANRSFPCFIGSGSRRVDQNDQPNLCVIEATISLLNSKGCLKKLPKFDYREDTF